MIEELFEKNRKIGTFRGFSHGGLEFHADLTLPYRRDFQELPVHGQFLLIQLAGPDEAVLGRITNFFSQGLLSTASGDDFSLRAMADDREVPESIRQQYLQYKVDLRVLGIIRLTDRPVFIPSHRRLPPVGAPVAFLPPELLKWVVGDEGDGASLGHFALGEFVHAEGDKSFQADERIRVIPPRAETRFPVKNLISRRSFVFARAGFGKSNLVKLLFSELYRETPRVAKRGHEKGVPVGTLIFDPDGEYFWPDDKNRPGLCDVPHLQERLVVFTDRKRRSPYYDAFTAGDIKLDIRRLRPSDVITIALPAENQEQQNIRKLKGLNDGTWRELVDLIHADGNAVPLDDIKTLLRLEPGSDAEATAARSNMTHIVKMLHDPNSQLLDALLAGLKKGCICVVDISRMHGKRGLILSGIILQQIFDHNQEQFTADPPGTIPCIAVLEEAQSVLNAREASGDGPYVRWVKEGRKYELGAMLITQQPGSIAQELLSQGDNWFVFHLLAEGDLKAIQRANAHFSDDLLSSLLNEPIPGQGMFWSSAFGRSYPIAFRARLFEALYQPVQGNAAVATAATAIKKTFADAGAPLQLPLEPADTTTTADKPIDLFDQFQRRAIEQLRANQAVMQRVTTFGIPWMGIQEALRDALPPVMNDRNQVAYQLVIRAMNTLFGPQNDAWIIERKESRSNPGRLTAWIRVLPTE